MSSQPTPPLPGKIISVPAIEKDVVWLKGHIVLVLASVALIAAIVMGSISLVEGLVERHDARTAATQQAIKQTADQNQAAMLSQLQQMRADDQVRDQQYQATIQSLVSRMAAERAATAKQVATDATLDTRAAADRLIGQTKASPSEVTVTNDTVTMDLPLTRTVVADLDQLVQSQSDVANFAAQLDAQKELTADAKGERDKAMSVVAADKVELIATMKSDAAECKLEMDKQASKDRKRGFWFNVASFVFGAFVGHRL